MRAIFKTSIKTSNSCNSQTNVTIFRKEKIRVLRAKENNYQFTINNYALTSLYTNSSPLLLFSISKKTINAEKKGYLFEDILTKLEL